MKRALLVSPHFAPSNLAGAQRTRLMASHLPEFGWEPIVVTVDPACYEETNDPASLALIPDWLRVERVRALPQKFCRRFGVGDISLRAQWELRRRVSQLFRSEKADLIFVTVLPGFASLVGAWAKRKIGLPFVLDYQDPWVSDWGARQPPWSKAGLSHWLATKLEPRVVAAADALTAVSNETLQSLRDRRLLRSTLPVEIIPIGASEEDDCLAAAKGLSRMTKQPGDFAIGYVGTVTERMLPIIRVSFEALRLAINMNDGRRLSLHFIGTSAQPDGTDRYSLAALARSYGLENCFYLEPRRIGYLDALRTMQETDALLLIGSTDSHYTASKIFPCWLSGKPVLALFHARSTVNDIARELGGVRVITYEDSKSLAAQTEQIAAALHQLTQGGSAVIPPRNEPAFAAYSAKTVARRYAELFDRVLRAKS
jgi:Glycosyl transferase 4-like domain